MVMEERGQQWRRKQPSPFHAADHGVSEVSLLQGRGRAVMQNDVFASSDEAVSWINYSVHLESSLHVLSPRKSGGRVEVQTPVSKSSEAGLEPVFKECPGDPSAGGCLRATAGAAPASWRAWANCHQPVLKKRDKTVSVKGLASHQICVHISLGPAMLHVSVLWNSKAQTTAGWTDSSRAVSDAFHSARSICSDPVC